jgi:hypothetical protein
MERKWKDVPGFESLYSVSDDGRVRRLARRVRNGVGWIDLPEREVPPTQTRGYLVVNLWRDNVARRWLVHRLVALAFLGPSDLSVDHINGDKADNRLENLRYCSLAANTQFQHAAGRVKFVRGEANGKSKLTEETVRQARALLADGATSKEVAATIGVSRGAIQAMREGRTWAHVI